MDFELDDGWAVYPIDGNTDKAFMGKKNQQRLFLKRNASPFLAALSMEEITPRLIWTKRISSGDTLTAQEWLNGQTLTKQQMQLPEVAHLLARVHNSKLLHRMLTKVGGQVVRPQDFIRQYLSDLPDDLRQHPLMADVLAGLKNQLPTLPVADYRVCHGDLNHKNWLLSDHRQLYLVDWDAARFADPASDISLLLCEYLPLAAWQPWLAEYGETMTPAMQQRVIWYAKVNLLLNIKDNYYRNQYHKMNHEIIFLEELMQQQLSFF
ncbi:phosphotransferase [Lactobacillus sp. CBA3605]|uniref:phosphotransferase family protein n=1 Tax=Lactobacillus sp. CBA3605 TaxID=2099788 RepID=UPI000CFC02DE|nr:phosphotransferase family protein [Lactobacillus sp. CBA3605]AVK62363.1 phosphotransferase [Lactobacillus sp. CBA3605]